MMESSRSQWFSRPICAPMVGPAADGYGDIAHGFADALSVPSHASCPLVHRAEAVAHARRIVGSMLSIWQVGEGAAESVLLVVSELVTNAIEHAQPPLALHLRRERADLRVWVGITDGGPATREGAWAASCSQEERGRGLCIVDALATAHGTHDRCGRITHWARLPVTEQPA